METAIDAEGFKIKSRVDRADLKPREYASLF